MAAWLEKTRSGGFRLRERIAGRDTGRTIPDQSEAEKALAEARARHANLPGARRQWRNEELARFDGLKGKHRASKQNYATAAEALRVLRGDTFTYLHLKPSLLYELGRIQNPEIMRLAAAEVCEQRMSYLEAQAFVSRLLGCNKGGNGPTLAAALRPTIARHTTYHPMTPREIALALHALAFEYHDPA